MGDDEEPTLTAPSVAAEQTVPERRGARLERRPDRLLEGADRVGELRQVRPDAARQRGQLSHGPDRPQPGRAVVDVHRDDVGADDGRDEQVAVVLGEGAQQLVRTGLPPVVRRRSRPPW